MSPGTSQKNSIIEWGFYTLYSQRRAMMAHKGLYENLNIVPHPKCTATANKFENIMLNPHK